VKPFPPETARVCTLAETGACEALVSAISFNNVFQIVRKARDGPPRAGHWSCCATSLPASLQTSAS